MSSSENAIAAHNSSFINQQNGDILPAAKSRPSRATMENIKSVHENPFYKNFGIRHTTPSYPRSVALEQSRHLNNSNGRSSSFENDDIGEYRPGSGYVHKLLDKFSSLTAREEQNVTISHMKRSSSLDELPLENETASDKPIVHRATGIGYEKPSYLSAAKLSHRARSIESLHHSYHKPHHINADSPRHAATHWEIDKNSATLKFHRDSKTIAPDIDFAREDIIIVENTTGAHLTENDDAAPKMFGSHEVILQNELPKPNTVLTVRNIFESASSGSGLYTRRQKPDSPMSPSKSVKLAFSPSHTAHVYAANHDGVSAQLNSHSPSPITSPRLSSDSHAKPLLQPSGSTIVKIDNLRHASDSIFYSRSEVTKSPTPTFSNNSSSHIPSHQVNSSDEDSPISPPVSFNDNKLHRFKRDNSVEDSGSSDSSHLTISLRSVASVKLAVSGKSGSSLSTSATSNYHKSGSATSSASFKNMLEDNKNVELPVMIFTKSNLSPKKNKSQRTKDYTLIDDESNELGNEEIDQGSKKWQTNVGVDETDKSTHETSNNIASHRKYFDTNAKTADKSSSDQNKIVNTKLHTTTIEVKKSFPKNAFDKEHLSLEQKSKQAGSEAELKLTKPVALRRTNITAKNRTQAPETPIHEPTSVAFVADAFENNQRQVTSLPSKAHLVHEELGKSPNSIITNESTEMNKEKSTPSKRSHPNDAPALSEQPLSKVSKDKSDSKEQPVKGIPSIIAQRLKKPVYDPSQVAEDVVSSPEPVNVSDVLSDEDSSEGNIFSRKHLTPTVRGSSLDNNDKDSLGSEIENEIASVRKKMEESRSKSVGPSPIFDSSQLTKKRREKKKQQSSASQDVPPLDLSGITQDHTMEYQPPLKRIEPCNIVFIGENAKTSRSLLTKQRKVKISIHFNDAKTETFEYPSEGIALERYLEDHPHETEEILVLEDFNRGGDESSDDVEIDVFETPMTPRGNSEDDLLKANTALAHTGSLQSYRGRFQQDYQLGSILLEQPVKRVEPEQTVDPEKLMLRPAEEDDTNTWSTSSSSDILF